MGDFVDTWAKAVARRISRRQLLGGVGALTAGGALGGLTPAAAALGSPRRAGPPARTAPAAPALAPQATACPSGFEPCGPICCAPGQSCETIGAFPVCVSTGVTQCYNWHDQWCPPDGCVDVYDDPDNCGSCGHRCPPPPPASGGASTGAAVCVAGVCGVACDSGYTACKSASTGEWSCVVGECPPSCTSPYADCGGICINVQTNPYNCGSCGHVCPAPANATGTCSGGNCTGAFTCDYGYTACGSACVDLAYDVNNCGACGYACATHCPPPSGYTSYCVAGVCENVQVTTMVC
jgi:hypothetical protein